MNASDSEIRGIKESPSLRVFFFFFNPRCMITLGIVETAFQILFSLALMECVKVSDLILLAVNAFHEQPLL